MARNQRNYSNDYYNSNDNRERNSGRYNTYQNNNAYTPRLRERYEDNEYDMSNEDYDNEMRYGRSGIERSRYYDDRDYTPEYRSSGTYDEDDYDSDFGNSSDYDDRTFRDRRLSGNYDNASRRDYGQYGGEYQREDNRRGISDYGRGSSHNDYSNYRGNSSDYNRDYPRQSQGKSSYSSSYEPQESESSSFRRRFSSNYRNDY